MFYFFVFFFKQKTAYEMRISDWSSDVCSSDLLWFPARCRFCGILVNFDQMGSESKRQQKFARLIQKDLGDIFHRELQHMLPNAMITITMVRATPDLSGVKVYLSFYNAPYVKEAMNTIKLNTADIRSEARRVGKEWVRTVRY